MFGHHLVKFMFCRAPFLALIFVCQFSSLANGQVFIDTVFVGNPGNAAKEVSEATGLVDSRFFKSGNFGAVDYVYRIGTTEVTNAQYTTFLNAVAGTNRYNLYVQNMEDDPRGGIIRRGENGSYTFSTKPLMADKPVVFVTYWSTLRFANWMHNGMPSGAPDLNRTATESGAYALLGRNVPQLFGRVLEREPDAQWFIPSEDEWFKAAYHKNDGATGNYYDFPTATNEIPGVATADEFGNISNPGRNIVNYANGADWNGLDGNLTTVGSAGAASASAYGTLDQAGNADEWTDTNIGFDRSGVSPGNTQFPIVRGGTFFQPEDAHIIGLINGSRDVGGPNGTVDHVGFRVATITVPFLLGDCNRSGQVDFLDISPFVSILATDEYLPEADINLDNTVGFLDIQPFILLLSSNQPGS